MLARAGRSADERNVSESFYRSWLTASICLAHPGTMNLNRGRKRKIEAPQGGPSRLPHRERKFRHAARSVKHQTSCDSRSKNYSALRSSVSAADSLLAFDTRTAFLVSEYFFALASHIF